VKSESNNLSAKGYLDGLASRGRHHFTSREARDALGASANATAKALGRLIKQGYLASPEREFYVIVPPEYRSLGCLPAEQFIPALMAEKGVSYYAGLLSAAQYYGAAHHRPQEFQVFLARNRRPIVCGRVRVAFIARKRVGEVSVRTLNTARGVIRVSTPEATAVDLAGYPEHAGGLDQVATVLSELAEHIDPAKLPEAAAAAPLIWAQRLGYLLELAGAESAAVALKDYVRGRVRDYMPLLSNGPKQGERNADWKVIVNATVEAEA
jgi:predicted transcriptional regulator of viral defense system